MSPAWWRAYRAKHRETLLAQQRAGRARRLAADPTLHARLAAQKAAWRAGQRAAGAGALVSAPPPELFLGHPLLEQARSLVRGWWYGDRLYHAQPEDAAAEAVLALLEDRDPLVAIRRFWADEKKRAVMELPLLGE